jgi:hypothetical protein
MIPGHGLDVAFVTHAHAPDLDEDEAALGPALGRLGLSWRAAPWDGEGFDWRSPRVVVLRSPWNYSRRRDVFLAWAERVAAVTALHNPIDVIRRNTHKGYLLDLAARGVPVVPTLLVQPSGAEALRDRVHALGWDDIVVKPAVSAGSWRTWRLSRGERSHEWTRARRLLATREALVQPFLPSVTKEGEKALVFFDGAYSHAIRKRSLFESSHVPQRVAADARPDEIDLALQALQAAGAGRLLYARVDIARGPDGAPLLMELELTEPRLFLGAAPTDATETFARAIAARA